MRFKQLGGKIVAKETYQSLGGNNVQNAVSRLNDVKADVVVTSTAGAFGALSTLISGLRSLGNNTPVLNSWAGDGTYWLPTNPKVTNYWFLTFASCFGDDPSAAVNKLAKQVKAGTGGFITGPSAIDGLVTAIKRANGSTKGIVLAKVMEKFRKVPTISGNVSFSREVPHGVRSPVPRDPDPGQRAEGRRHDRGQGRSEDLGASCRKRAATKRRGGPGTHSGPPPCHGPSRACMPFATSRSS